jgi:hypothetical protein
MMELELSTLQVKHCCDIGTVQETRGQGMPNIESWYLRTGEETEVGKD